MTIFLSKKVYLCLAILLQLCEMIRKMYYYYVACYSTELSEVLWNMVFKLALQRTGVIGGIAIFLLFSFWASMWL